MNIQNNENNANNVNNSYCVSLTHIEVAFDDTYNVLKDINLNIKQGEFVSLIGRSGCGKTTLLKVISGLLKPTSGSINVTDMQAIGFQDARLIPWLKIGENVVFGLSDSKNNLKKLANNALSKMQLEEYANKWPSQLSGGQAQRVSLARALVRNPELLLLDEPFGALDALTRLDMQDLLAKLRTQNGWSTIMVTHDIAEAVRLSDRILMLQNGVISRQWNIDRSSVDSQGRPTNHVSIEDDLRLALK